MPFYEYRRADGTTFEVMQKMSEPPLTEDPDSGLPVQRVFHPIAVHFKGKGFYSTDYGSKRREREQADAQAAEKKQPEQGADSSKAGQKPEPAKAEAKGSTAEPKPKPTQAES